MPNQFYALQLLEQGFPQDHHLSLSAHLAPKGAYLASELQDPIAGFK